MSDTNPEIVPESPVIAEDQVVTPAEAVSLAVSEAALENSAASVAGTISATETAEEASETAEIAGDKADEAISDTELLRREFAEFREKYDANSSRLTAFLDSQEPKNDEGDVSEVEVTSPPKPKEKTSAEKDTVSERSTRRHRFGTKR